MTNLWNAKPFVIAEVGSNWQTFEQAKDSIAMAKQCGASAVKFQAFSGLALYGYLRPQGGDDEQYRLPLDWLPALKEKADACGIEFMCTAFSPELVEAVDPYVEVHKVASSDNTSIDMLSAVKRTGKPVILSCGAASKGDIEGAVKGVRYPDGTVAWEGFGDHPLVLLYCASAYPSRRHNLFLMEELRELYGKPVGFSDHSLDVIYAPLAAARHHGAVVIEKHFTAFPNLDSPDRHHSLTTDEFKIMCDYLRGQRDGGGLNPTSEERDMFLRHNRRLVATKDIAAGAVLKYGENFGAYRSLEDDTHGFSPFAYKLVDGKRAKKAIPRGKGVGPGDFG